MLGEKPFGGSDACGQRHDQGDQPREHRWPQAVPNREGREQARAEHAEHGVEGSK